MIEMQSNAGRRNINHQLCSDHLVGRAFCARENGSKMLSNCISTPTSSSPTLLPYGGVNFIEHRVSKMDTLAGVAIKYGVEVADIKRINGLVTDLQMFALKSLQIPLPGRHPPSPALSNGSANSGQSNLIKTPPHRAKSDLFESFQSLRLKSPHQRVSPAMTTLQGYYGLKPLIPSNHKETAPEVTDIDHCFEDGLLPNHSLSPDPSLNRVWISESLINSFLHENGELVKEVTHQTPEMLLKEDTSNGSGFSSITGKGLALRPKSASRTNLAPESESGGLNHVSVGLGDSLMVDGLNAVRKSSSTSNLQDQENSSSLSIWPTSKWSFAQDLQAFSNAAITMPIFDGLPKPITRRNKAALD